MNIHLILQMKRAFKLFKRGNFTFLVWEASEIFYLFYAFIDSKYYNQAIYNQMVFPGANMRLGPTYLSYRSRKNE